MKIHLPGFVRATGRAVWGKKWYIAGAFGLVIAGALAAFFTTRDAVVPQVGNRNKPAADTVELPSGDDRATFVAGATTDGTKEDEDKKDNATPSTPKTTPAPTTPTPETPAAFSCLNQPPSGFGLSNTPSVVSLAKGETTEEYEITTFGGTNNTGPKVIWVTTAPADDELSLHLRHAPSEFVNDYGYRVEATPDATPGSYHMTLRVEDGSGNTCATRTITIVVSES